MAVSIISSVIKGSRVQKTVEGHGASHNIADEKVYPSAVDAVTIIKPTLVVGEKVSAYKPLLASVSVGTLATSIAVSGEARYMLIRSMPLATRREFDGERAFFAETHPAEQDIKTNTGISTHGIGYVPTATTDNSGKELRRWPRNWYGDNIKS